MHVLVLVVSVFLLQTNVSAGEPFEPVLAADQPRITTESLYYELEQYRQIANWHEARDQAALQRQETELLKKEFERASVLVKSRQMSLESYVIAKFKFEHSEQESARLDAMADRAQALGMLARLQVLSEGGSSDLRREVAQAMIQSEEALVKALSASLVSTQEELRITALKLESGRNLLKTASIPQAEFEKREHAVNNVKGRASALERQISVAQRAVTALKLTLERI